MTSRLVPPKRAVRPVKTRARLLRREQHPHEQRQNAEGQPAVADDAEFRLRQLDDQRDDKAERRTESAGTAAG